jgi:hypothetical protein
MEDVKLILTVTFWTSDLLWFISACFLIAEAVSQGSFQVHDSLSHWSFLFTASLIAMGTPGWEALCLFHWELLCSHSWLSEKEGGWIQIKCQHCCIHASSAVEKDLNVTSHFFQTAKCHLSTQGFYTHSMPLQELVSINHLFFNSV